MAKRPKKKTPVSEKAPVNEVVTTATDDADVKVSITPQTMESAAIIEKAINATIVRAKVPVSEAPATYSDATGDSDSTSPVVVPAAVPQPSKYDILLGRYCKVVSEYMNGTSSKRPIGSFVSLMDYVIGTQSQVVYAAMLKFFILEANGLMSPHNALNGIETLNDLTMKTRVMTASTVFNGLAIQKTTGRRPTFSVGAVRQIIKNERFTNWVNVVMNS